MDDGSIEEVAIMVYDDEGHRVGMEVDEAVDGTRDRRVVYENDDAGNHVRETAHDLRTNTIEWVVTRDFDDDGHVVGSLLDEGGDGNIEEHLLAYYDESGNRVRVEELYPEGQTGWFDYVYGPEGNVLSEEWGGFARDAHWWKHWSYASSCGDAVPAEVLGKIRLQARDRITSTSSAVADALRVLRSHVDRSGVGDLRTTTPRMDVRCGRHRGAGDAPHLVAEHASRRLMRDVRERGLTAAVASDPSWMPSDTAQRAHCRSGASVSPKATFCPPRRFDSEARRLSAASRLVLRRKKYLVYRARLSRIQGRILDRGSAMALSIKNDEADRLARELAELTGESLTEAVLSSLRERLVRQRATRGRRPLAERLMEVGRRHAQRPLQDPRKAEELLGYDENGLPS